MLYDGRVMLCYGKIGRKLGFLRSLYLINFSTGYILILNGINHIPYIGRLACPWCCEISG